MVDREKALADADGMREKLKGEAEGLTEKAAAMAALDDASRGHEEYRLRLEAEKEIRLAGINVQRQVAEAQAKVLAAGLEKADIDIVGGDSDVLRPDGRLDHAGQERRRVRRQLRRRAGARGAVPGRIGTSRGLDQLLGSFSTPTSGT